MPGRPNWQMVFVLPNLLLGNKNQDQDELTLGLEGIAIVPASDARVVELMEWSKPARTFLEAFHDGNGRAITPAVLIVREDWLGSMNRNVEPIISFRNAAAMCSVLLSRTRWPEGSWLGAPWSDSFDYHSAQLRPDGSKFDVLTPALQSIGFRLKGLSLTYDIRLPRNHLGPIDDHLGIRLGRAWRMRYRRKRHLKATGKVFRSLEAAYEAAGMSFRNYSSLDEVGLEAVNWATATEVLAAPAKRNVSKWDCIRLIGNGRKLREPELWHRRYRVARPRRKGDPLRFSALNFPQWVFLCLHNARSKFVHGETVPKRLLAPFGENAPSLLSLASTVYRIALVAYLEQHWPWPESLNDFASIDLTSGMAYRRHLLAAVKPPEDE